MWLKENPAYVTSVLHPRLKIPTHILNLKNLKYFSFGCSGTVFCGITKRLDIIDAMYCRTSRCRPAVGLRYQLNVTQKVTLWFGIQSVSCLHRAAGNVKIQSHQRNWSSLYFCLLITVHLTWGMSVKMKLLILVKNPYLFLYIFFPSV